MKTYKAVDRLARGKKVYAVEWWEGRTHRSKRFLSDAERREFLKKKRNEDDTLQKVARRAKAAGDYVARFSRLTPEEQNALLGALEAMRAAGGGAEDVREAAAAHASGLGGGHTVREAVEAHVEEVARLRRPRTAEERKRILMGLVREHGDLPLGKLSRAVCREWISGKDLSIPTSAHRHAALSALLHDCVRRDWLKGNPMEGLAKPRAGRREEVAIFTPADAEKLLRTAERTAPELVPYLAIGLFAGLRPERELALLEGRDVDLEGKEIYVRRGNAKTGQERTVPVSENLCAWLRKYPVGEKVWYGRMTLRRVVKESGVEWKHDAMRHSRASYRLAQTRDATRTADEMGHDVATLKRHYANRRIPASEVARFWKIRPK